MVPWPRAQSGGLDPRQHFVALQSSYPSAGCSPAEPASVSLDASTFLLPRCQSRRSWPRSQLAPFAPMAPALHQALEKLNLGNTMILRSPDEVRKLVSAHRWKRKHPEALRRDFGDQALPFQSIPAAGQTSTRIILVIVLSPWPNRSHKSDSASARRGNVRALMSEVTQILMAMEKGACRA